MLVSGGGVVLVSGGEWCWLAGASGVGQWGRVVLVSGDKGVG